MYVSRDVLVEFTAREEARVAVGGYTRVGAACREPTAQIGASPHLEVDRVAVQRRRRGR